jgi:hypothetical protein
VLERERERERELETLEVKEALMVSKVESLSGLREEMKETERRDD